MVKTKLFCISLTFILTVNSALAKNCIKVDQCSCQMDDGSGTIELQKIGQPTNPLVMDVKSSTGGSFLYSFNPCYPFTEGTCSSVAACQFDPNLLLFIDIGAADKVSFSYNDTHNFLTAIYEAGDGARSSIVNYICNSSAESPKVTVYGEIEMKKYLFSVESKYACSQSTTPANCTQLDQCSCRFDDGRGIVDLTDLGKHGTPLISDVRSGLYYYSFNPCFSFNEGTCNGVAGCQLENKSGVYIEIAAAFNVNLSYDGNNIVGNYTSSDATRSTIVTFVCDPLLSKPIAIVNGEICLRTYGFTIISKYSCPRKEVVRARNATFEIIASP